MKGSLVGGASGPGGAKRTSCSRPAVCIEAPASALGIMGIGVKRSRDDSERMSAVLGGAASPGAEYWVEDAAVRFLPLRVNTSYDSGASAIELPGVFHYRLCYRKRPA
jgi:hypothetical protein